MAATYFACIPVPRTLAMFTDDDGRMPVTCGVRDQVTGHMVGYLNTRRGNRAFVRDLLADKQTAYAALLEQAVTGIEVPA